MCHCTSGMITAGFLECQGDQPQPQPQAEAQVEAVKAPPAPAVHALTVINTT